MPNGYPTEQACDAARDRLKRLGLSAKDWATQNGLTPSTVYAVLNGQKKCLRGESHKAAVLLGMKEGETSAVAEQ
ncbi:MULTISPECIES: DNA-binding protein [unclassified Pseudomonas]|uniref:DNA-binding protein n=1 Tax=unclassified Pseudomonas TaxID=196821 RepID=UPI0023630CCB|nr:MULTISPECIES: DNA-binding protein [unclassified Pseudomonas]